MLPKGLIAMAGFLFSAKRGRWPQAGWGAESRYGPTKVRDDDRVSRLGPKRWAAPHPALRATFPSKLGKGPRNDWRCVNPLGLAPGIARG